MKFIFDPANEIAYFEFPGTEENEINRIMMNFDQPEEFKQAYETMTEMKKFMDDKYPAEEAPAEAA